MKSTKPFPETIQGLLEMEDLSGRQLHARIARQDPENVRAHSVYARAIAGTIPVQPHHMEAIAKALFIVPETFAEYRLWKARRSFDPGEIGWDAAVRNLQRYEGDEGEDGPEALDPEDVARRLDPGSGGHGGQAASS